MTTRLALLVTLAAACADPGHAAPAATASPGGADSPEAAVTLLLDAFAAGDPVRLVRALPADGRLARALACEPGRGPSAGIDALRSKLARELPRTRGVAFRLASLETLDTRRIAPGQDVGGCRARAPVELRIVRLGLDVDDGGAAERTREQAVVAALDGRWFVLDY